MNLLSHHSFSSINTFQNCERSWFHNYILRERTPPGSSAQFGSAFEAVVALRSGLAPASDKPGKEVSTEIEGLDEAVTIYLNHRAAALLKTATTYQKKIEITPNQFASLCLIHDVPEIDLNVPIIGYTDFQGVAEFRPWILDIKTADRSGFKPSWGLQDTLYGIAEGVSRLSIHLLVRTKVPKVQTFSFLLSKAIAAWALTVIGSTVARMNAAALSSSAFLSATPGFWCSWCPCSLGCPGAAMNDMKEVAA